MFRVSEECEECWLCLSCSQIKDLKNNTHFNPIKHQCKREQSEQRIFKRIEISKLSIIEFIINIEDILKLGTNAF